MGKSFRQLNVNKWESSGRSMSISMVFFNITELQISGVPSLGRAELQTVCDDFINVIGTSSVCALYKGTLSSNYTEWEFPDVSHTRRQEQFS
ncbi:hypothetical protein ACP70R_033027 [Stipagrostis hirtigluma subsp. patula]